jgi:AmpE protein
MKLLVLVIVLGLRQSGLGRDIAATVSGLMRRWRDGWLERGRREGWRDGVVLGFIVLPPVLLVLVAVLALGDLGGSFRRLLLSLASLLVMLVVLLDRRQPEAFEREQDAWAAADEIAHGVITQADPVVLQEAANAEFARARSGLIAEQLRELFAPLFWFLLLGPVAAFAYYFLRLAADASTSTVSATAARLLHYVEWPVARVLGLSFALAGDFVATWQHWRAHVLEKEPAAVALLDESAQAAQPVDLRLRADGLPGPVLTHALAHVAALLQRALVIWIVLLALHTLWP